MVGLCALRSVVALRAKGNVPARSKPVARPGDTLSIRTLVVGILSGADVETDAVRHARLRGAARLAHSVARRVAAESVDAVAAAAVNRRGARLARLLPAEHAFLPTAVRCLEAVGA